MVDGVGFQCCFCGDGIRAPGPDPVRLVIPLPDDGIQELYCHPACLRRVLHPSVPLGLPDEDARAGQRLFCVADVFALRVGRVVIATDCPLRHAPVIRVGDPVEFRNPDGSVFRSVVAGVELFDPPDPDRSFGFPLPSGTPASAVQVGAEVWSVVEDDLA